MLITRHTYRQKDQEVPGVQDRDRRWRHLYRLRHSRRWWAVTFLQDPVHPGGPFDRRHDRTAGSSLRLRPFSGPAAGRHGPGDSRVHGRDQHAGGTERRYGRAHHNRWFPRPAGDAGGTEGGPVQPAHDSRRAAGGALPAGWRPGTNSRQRRGGTAPGRGRPSRKPGVPGPGGRRGAGGLFPVLLPQPLPRAEGCGNHSPAFPGPGHLPLPRGHSPDQGV